MRHRASRPSLETGMAGDGPAATATVAVGIDGSSASWAAFCWAGGEARRPGGRAVAVFTSPAGGASRGAMRAVAGFAAAGYRVADPAVHDQTQNPAADMLHAVVVPPHCEALNLPGGVSDETSPGRSPRSHRS